MWDSILSTLFYTVLTLVIVLLIKICNDKRKEWKALQEELAEKERMSAHEIVETDDEKLRQEEAIRKIIDEHYKENPVDGDEKSKFDV